MPTYPEPLKTWNALVNSTVKRTAMQVRSVSSNQLVTQVTKGKEYYLWLSFKNTSNVELKYENVVIRLVGQADQVDSFINPPGSIDYNGCPRVHLETGALGAGNERGWMVRFKVRKTMSTKSLKFNTGVYGYPEPQGHYWKIFSPTA